MSKKIFEEKGGPHRGHAAGATDVEKQASQLASDTRYKVKQTMSKGTKLNPAQVAKAYLAQLAKSPAPPAVKAIAKKKLMGEEYTEDIKQLVESSLVNALVHVFAEESEEKVWIVVTDKKTGNTYRRRATREKIAELRANPNISRVEITSYHPDEDDDKKGEKTARVKAGKGLKNDGNLANNYPPYDKVTRGDVIAGATGKDQMGGKKKVKEEFIGEVKQKSDPENKKITGEKVNNYNGKDAVIKVFPSIEEQMGNEVAQNTQQQKQQPKKDIVDPTEKRQISTLQQFQNKERQLNQQKLSAQKAGKIPVGSVQMNSFEPEGDQIDEKITAKTDMGMAIKDFYASKSPQLAGRTKEERRKAAIAAVLTARRGGKELGEECECEDEKEPKMKKTEDGAEDPRSIPTKISLAKNKLRAMGLKMSYEPEGDQLSEREDSPYEKASDAALDKRYGYGKASGDKRSFGRAANRSSAAAALRAIRRGERSGSGTSTEAGADAVHRGWAKTAKTSTDQTPEKKAKRAQLANTEYNDLPDDEKEKDRVSFNAVKAVYKAKKSNLSASYEPEGEVIDERRREEKEAGTPRAPRNPAFELVAKSMGTGRMGVKPRGVKKEKGAPTPGPSVTPAQKVAKRRAAAQRAQDNMSSRFD